MKSSTLMRTLVFTALLVFLASCQRKDDAVTLAGSTAFQPFAEKLAEDFMSANKGANITVQGGGSAVGINAANSGAAQIGMADLIELPTEAAQLKGVIVARDGIAVVINPANPVSDITVEQIRGLFSGTIKNWKDVGGADKPVTVVSREAGSGTRSSFEKIIGGISLSKEAVIQDSNGTIRETVANDANAVGYLSHGLLSEKIKALSVNGQPSTTEAILAGAYPLVRPVYFLTKEPVSTATQAFIDYVLSPEGQKTIKDNGLIPAK